MVFKRINNFRYNIMCVKGTLIIYLIRISANPRKLPWLCVQFYMTDHYLSNTPLIFMLPRYQSTCIWEHDKTHYISNLWVNLRNNDWICVVYGTSLVLTMSGTILDMGSANEGRRFSVTSFIIDWIHTHSDPCICWVFPLYVNQYHINSWLPQVESYIDSVI